jgi:intergrase/recombinase
MAKYSGSVPSWSTGTEKLDAFTRFFDDTKDLDTMIRWLKEAMQILPTNYANFFLFCTLTGMRCSEALASAKLIKNPDTFKRYYDPDLCLLRHYAFSDLFIRRTKAVYISIADRKIVGIVQNIDKVPTYNGLKMISRRRSLSMKIKYCRKIYASWLHRCGESSDLIDMLQGRIGKNIFLKHYLTPDTSFKMRVLDALEKLQNQL